MPTYEYRCPQGHDFELFQKISDKPRAKCPTCGKVASRLISGGAGLLFKGTGFYITDYGKDGKGPRKESTPSASESAGPGAGKDPVPEAKPAAEKSEKPKKTAKKAKE